MSVDLMIVTIKGGGKKMAWHNCNCKDDPWVRFNFSKLVFAQNFFELDHLNCAGMRRC